MNGLGWPAGTNLTLSVNGSSLFTTTMGPSFWDPSVLIAFFDLTNLHTLQTGDYVTVSDGTTSVAVPIDDFRVTNVDVDTDTIYGLATPGASIGGRYCYS
jgi:hypothetical protein